MSSTQYLFRIAFLFLLVSFTSCVKDVDLDQYHEIVLPPVADIDLVHFDLSLEEFTPGPGGNLRAYDETRLEFLDDDYIQTGLMQAEFDFRFKNSFESPFTINFFFRSESNAIRHQIKIEVPAGSSAKPVIVDFSEVIETAQIEKLRKSIKVSVEVLMGDGLVNPDGALILKSKGIYHFEF